jgi:NAD+ kinase
MIRSLGKRIGNTPLKKKNISFVASNSPDAADALVSLQKRYGNCDLDGADIIVALGGDGFMLATLHRFMNSGVPVYGMNKGTIGFLMNEYSEEDLYERLESSEPSTIHPLDMSAEDMSGSIHRAKAINEVSLLRQSYQAASLGIRIDGRTRLDPLICDGIMVATPAGSTAYNLSAHGPILPLEAPLLALTPVSPFRPRRWRGALLPNSSKVEITINEAEKRPVNAVADNAEIKSVRRVLVEQDRDSQTVILFDPHHSWDERILAEQFQY